MIEREGIPTFIEDGESGSSMKILMGYSIFEKSIYVDTGDVERAKAIIAELESDVL